MCNNVGGTLGTSANLFIVMDCLYKINMAPSSGWSPTSIYDGEDKFASGT